MSGWLVFGENILMVKSRDKVGFATIAYSIKKPLSCKRTNIRNYASKKDHILLFI